MNHTIIPQNAPSIGGISNINQSKTATESGEKQSPLSEELSYLDMSLNENESAIQLLGEKLERISLPAMEQPAGKTVDAPLPMQSDVVRFIRLMRERLQRQTYSIRDLIERQQVR